MLRVFDLSGFVARNLSGFHIAQGGRYEADKGATGDRKMRFEEAYEGWNAGRLTQAEAARILGVCERSFRRYMWCYEEYGLIDQRLEQASNRQAPVYEAMALTDEYRRRYMGWNIKHFHNLYKRTGGTRSYTWVKRRLQEAGLVPKLKKRGTHRKRRERSALPGMMIHQDGSTHEWVIATCRRSICQPSMPSLLSLHPRKIQLL